MMDSKTFFEGIGIYRHKYLEQDNPNEYYFCEGMASGYCNSINEGVGDGKANAGGNEYCNGRV